MKKIKLSGNSVTIQDVENSIAVESYIKQGKKITVCHLTLVDGFEVVGTSGVVDPDNYNTEIGNRIARENAINRVWQHLGSILQHTLAE